MDHLRWVRGQDCLVPGCAGKAEAHHVRTAANAGTGLKPSDQWAVPLCHRHHAELHHRGRRAFELRYGVDLGAEAIFHAAASGSAMP